MVAIIQKPILVQQNREWGVSCVWQTRRAIEWSDPANKKGQPYQHQSLWQTSQMSHRSIVGANTKLIHCEKLSQDIKTGNFFLVQYLWIVEATSQERFKINLLGLKKKIITLSTHFQILQSENGNGNIKISLYKKNTFTR